MHRRFNAGLFVLLICLTAIHSPAQTLTTIDTFTVTQSGALDLRNLLQGSDGNLYTTALSLPAGVLNLLRVTHTGSMSMTAVQPFTDCFAELQGSDGNFYGGDSSSSPRQFCRIMPNGTSSEIPTFNQGFLDNGISLDSSGGSLPIQGLDGSLYGTFSSTLISGGPIGVVWKMSLSGAFSIFSTFPSDQDLPYFYSTLIQGKDGNLYGTTTDALFDGGTVFKVSTAGSMTFLHTFPSTGADGIFPTALVWGSDGSLYGTTGTGGSSNAGTFFKIDPAGTFSVLYNFQTAPTNSLYGSTFVQAPDGNFYGLQASAGANGDGALFRLTASGVYSVAYSFTQSNSGPTTLINGSDGSLYGITENAQTLSETLFKFTTGASLPAAPAISAGGIISASGFGAFTSIAPGTFIEIYGSNLAPDTRGWTGADFAGITAPTSLDGTSVSIGGVPAYVNYISPGQVNVLVPSNLPTGPQPITVTSSAGTSAGSTINVNAVEPGLLAIPLFDVQGIQYTGALNLDGSYVLPSNAIAGISSHPANAGDIIVLYGVGFGPVTPDTPAGQIAQVATALNATFEVSIGGAPATVQYAGLAPGFTGLYQFNVTVPNVPAAAAAPLTFTLNGVAGAQTLFIAVGN